MNQVQRTKDVPAPLWSSPGYSYKAGEAAVKPAKGYSAVYGLYSSPASAGDTSGGGPPFIRPRPAAACACDVGVSVGIRGDRMMGAPAGVGDLSCGAAISPPPGAAINLGPSGKQGKNISIMPGYKLSYLITNEYMQSCG